MKPNCFGPVKIQAAILLGFLLLFQHAWSSEFLIVDKEVSWATNAPGAFHTLKPDSTMPRNWSSPDDYYHGQIHTRYEILSVASKTPCGMQFDLFQWKDAEHKICGELCEDVRWLTNGVGSVAVNASSPSTWWKAFGGVDFSKISDFQSMSPTIWCNDPKSPIGKPKEGGDDAGVAWSKRFNWFPITLRVTLVAVSAGSTFSGWDNYIGAGARAKQPAPSQGDPKKAGSDQVKVEAMKIVDLGTEHFPTAAYRRGPQGPRIALWGDYRIVEFPIEAGAQPTEVVARTKDVERPTKNDWLGFSNGGCAIDVNGDGIDELVVERAVNNKPKNELLWFEEVPGQQAWTEHLIARMDHPKHQLTHDVEPYYATVNGMAVKGVIVGLGWKQPVLYFVPEAPGQSWTKNALPPLTEGFGEYWGTATGDIAGRGRTDFAFSLYWAESPADPVKGTWTLHRYADPEKGWKEGNRDPMWKSMLKDAVGDMDGDGKLDIIATQAECGPDTKKHTTGGRLSIFRQPKDNTAFWPETVIAEELYCPHSLVVADANGDGKPDIIIGEMTAGGWELARRANPKVCLYLNQGNLQFKRQVISEGVGVHEMRLAPQKPGDKQLFIFTSDEIQPWYFGQMTTHVVGWTIGP